MERDGGSPDRGRSGHTLGRGQGAHLLVCVSAVVHCACDHTATRAEGREIAPLMEHADEISVLHANNSL